MQVIIGVDPHKASHTAVAIDTDEDQLDSKKVRASRPVFVGERGGPLGTVSLQTCFHEARRKTGITQFTLHDLRHAGGTMAAWTGATTKELMARLGHSTHDAALRSQHAAQTRDAGIAAKLDVFRQAVEWVARARKTRARKT
jgi:integrase